MNIFFLHKFPFFFLLSFCHWSVCLVVRQSPFPQRHWRQQYLLLPIFCGCYLSFSAAAAAAASHWCCQCRSTFCSGETNRKQENRSVFIIMIIVCHYCVSQFSISSFVSCCLLFACRTVCLSQHKKRIDRRHFCLCAHNHSQSFKYANTKIQNYILSCLLNTYWWYCIYAPVCLINTFDCDIIYSIRLAREKGSGKRERERAGKRVQYPVSVANALEPC